MNNIESRLRDEEFWETLGVGVFHYVQDVMLMLFYTLFLLVPQREVSRARSLMVRRIRTLDLPEPENFRHLNRTHSFSAYKLALISAVSFRCFSL